MLVILAAVAVIITAPFIVGGRDMPCEWADLKVTPDRLEWTVDEGSVFTPPYQRLKVEKVGDGVLSANWVVSSDAPWLVVEPVSGKGQGFLTVRIKPSGMKVGDYHATLRFRSAVEITIAPADLPVVLTVMGTTPEPPDEPPHDDNGNGDEPDTPPDEPEPTQPKCWLSRAISQLFGLDK